MKPEPRLSSSSINFFFSTRSILLFLPLLLDAPSTLGGQSSYPGGAHLSTHVERSRPVTLEGARSAGFSFFSKAETCISGFIKRLGDSNAVFVVCKLEMCECRSSYTPAAAAAAAISAAAAAGRGLVHSLISLISLIRPTRAALLFRLHHARLLHTVRRFGCEGGSRRVEMAAAAAYDCVR